MINKEYLRMAYKMGFIAPTKELANEALRVAVKTPTTPAGVFTFQEYEELTGVKF